MAYKFVSLEKDKNKKFRLVSGHQSFENDASRKVSSSKIRKLFQRKEDAVLEGQPEEILNYRHVVKSLTPDSSDPYLQTLDEIYFK